MGGEPCPNNTDPGVTDHGGGLTGEPCPLAIPSCGRAALGMIGGGGGGGLCVAPPPEDDADPGAAGDVGGFTGVACPLALASPSSTEDPFCEGAPADNGKQALFYGLGLS